MKKAKGTVMYTKGAYYHDQLSRITFPYEYAPTIKIHANGNGRDTNHMDLNKESAEVLIEWLTVNFLKP